MNKALVTILAIVDCVFSSSHYGNYGSTATSGIHGSISSKGPAPITYCDVMCIIKGQCRPAIDTGQIILYNRKVDIKNVMKLNDREKIAKEVVSLPCDVRAQLYREFVKEYKLDFAALPKEGIPPSYFTAFAMLFEKPAHIFATQLYEALYLEDYVAIAEVLFSVSNRGVAEILKAYKELRSKEFTVEFESTVDKSPRRLERPFFLKELIVRRCKAEPSKDTENDRPADVEKAMRDSEEIFQKLDDGERVEDTLNERFLEDSRVQMKCLLTMDFNQVLFEEEKLTFSMMLYKMYPFCELRKVYIALGELFKDPYRYYLNRMWRSIKGAGTDKWYTIHYLAVARILIGRAEIDLGNIIEASAKKTEEIAAKLKVAHLLLNYHTREMNDLLRMFIDLAWRRNEAAREEQEKNDMEEAERLRLEATMVKIQARPWHVPLSRAAGPGPGQARQAHTHHDL